MRQFEDHQSSWSHRRLAKLDESSQRRHPISMDALRRLQIDMARRQHKLLLSLHFLFYRLLPRLVHQRLLRKRNRHKSLSLLFRRPSNLHRLVLKLATKSSLTHLQMLPLHRKRNLQARLLQHQEHREPMTLEMYSAAVYRLLGLWRVSLGRVQFRVGQQVPVQTNQ